MAVERLGFTRDGVAIGVDGGRIARVCRGDGELTGVVGKMVGVARTGLRGMYVPGWEVAEQEEGGERAEMAVRITGDGRKGSGEGGEVVEGEQMAGGRFVFTCRGGAEGKVRLEGTSVRYGAMALLGMSWLDAEERREILHGESAEELCGRLIDAAAGLGDVAVAAWAAVQLRHPRREEAVARLVGMSQRTEGCATVEAAWVVSALATALLRGVGAEGAEGAQGGEGGEVERAKERLMGAYVAGSGLFGHGTRPEEVRWARRHVGCFADEVYPIQALARYARATGDRGALEAAGRCARAICRRQGTGGQWWWHYDVRTGEVIEGYPVYSVHQDGMAPMALLDLAEAGGVDCTEAVRRGVRWMARRPEPGPGLIDEGRGVIWRKVGRRGQRKLVRKVRGAVSRVWTGGRLRWLDRAFPAGAIDFESRPYHLGWILQAWLGGVS